MSPINIVLLAGVVYLLFVVGMVDWCESAHRRRERVTYQRSRVVAMLQDLLAGD
jgi:hypothetical protein